MSFHKFIKDLGFTEILKLYMFFFSLKVRFPWAPCGFILPGVYVYKVVAALGLTKPRIFYGRHRGGPVVIQRGADDRGGQVPKGPPVSNQGIPGTPQLNPERRPLNL